MFTILGKIFYGAITSSMNIGGVSFMLLAIMTDSL